MDERSEDQASLNPKRSDYSLDSTPTIAASPESPVHHRPGYHRITSLNEVDTSYRRPGVDISGGDTQLEPVSSLAVPHKGFGQSSQGRGLGIGNVDTPRLSSVSRVAVGSKSSPSPPPSADPLLSPSSTRVGRDFRGLETHSEDDEPDYGGHRRNDSNPAVFEPFTASSDQERLHRKTPSGTETHIGSLERSGRITQLIGGR